MRRNGWPEKVAWGSIITQSQFARSVELELAIMLATIGITIDDGNCGQVRPKDAFFMVGIASQPLVFINSLS